MLDKMRSAYAKSLEAYANYTGNQQSVSIENPRRIQNFKYYNIQIFIIHFNLTQYQTVNLIFDISVADKK